MPRMHRVTPGGMVFHVINRGVGRMRLFQRDADYAAFEAILEETLESRPMRDWLSWVNRADTEAELEALRRSVNRSRPYGSEQWVERVVSKLGLEWTIRSRGRPRKEKPR